MDFSNTYQMLKYYEQIFNVSKNQKPKRIDLLEKELFGDDLQKRRLRILEWISFRNYLFQVIMETVKKAQGMKPKALSQKNQQNFNNSDSVQLNVLGDSSIQNNEGLHNEKKTKFSKAWMPQNIRCLLDSAIGDMVIIGPNGTQIEKGLLEKIKWNLSNGIITRNLLMAVFGHETLATSSLTGKPSTLKKQLDPKKIEDIIHMLTTRLNMSKDEIRYFIGSKCTDASTLDKKREKRNLNMSEIVKK